MPIVKPISGHTTARGVFRYLTRNGRALASNYLNINVPQAEFGYGAQKDDCFDWSAVMDTMRHAARNDVAWRGKRVRNYKYYIVSPNPQDALSLEDLRELILFVSASTP